MNTFARQNRRLALRSLIANGERLVAHFAEWETELPAVAQWPAASLQAVAAARQRLADYRAELAGTADRA